MPIDRYKFIFNTANVFHIYAFVPAGSVYETAALHGASHLLEHMLFRNTGEYTANLSKSLTFVGGKYNAVTYKDMTYFFIKTHIDQFQDAIQMMHQIVGNANFTEKDLQTERKVVLEEFHQAEDNFNHVLENAAWSTLFPEDHPYCRSVIGTKKTLSHISADRLKKYYQDRYAKYTVLINCPASYEGKVRSLLTRVWGPNQHVSLWEDAVHSLSEPLEPKVIVLNRNLSQYMTRLMFPAFPACHVRENMMLEFVSYVLTGSGLYSLLNHTVREVRGLVYTVQSYVEPFRYLGLFHIQLSSSNKETVYILSLVLSILYTMTQKLLPRRVFAYFKTSFLNSRRVKFASEDYRTEWHGTNHFYEDATSEPQYLRMIETMTPQDVRGVCQKVFDFDKQSVLAVGDYPEPSQMSLHILDLLTTYKKMTLGG